MLEILPIPAFNDNYIWLIVDQDTKKTVAVDPGDATPVLAALEIYGVELAAILITHHHADHTGGIHDLLAKTPVPVYGPATESIPHCSHPLNGDDQIHIDAVGLNFRVIDIPGHTSGHIAYVGHNMVFCGDTLFAGGCGRLFEGTPEQMCQSLSLLAKLPHETLAYCAHEYTADNLRFALEVEPSNLNLQQRIKLVNKLRTKGIPTVPSTIATELETNPFLRCHQKTVQDAASTHAGQNLTNPVEVFTVIREWKNGF